jgi:hypothetical protein
MRFTIVPAEIEHLTRIIGLTTDPQIIGNARVMMKNGAEFKGLISEINGPTHKPRSVGGGVEWGGEIVISTVGREFRVDCLDIADIARAT